MHPMILIIKHMVLYFLCCFIFVLTSSAFFKIVERDTFYLNEVMFYTLVVAIVSLIPYLCFVIMVYIANKPSFKRFIFSAMICSLLPYYNLITKSISNDIESRIEAVITYLFIPIAYISLGFIYGLLDQFTNDLFQKKKTDSDIS